MSLDDAHSWPIWIAFAFLMVAAGINLRSLTVPNGLTFPAVVAAWAAALSVDAGLAPPSGGGLASSLLSMLVGGGLLLPFYRRGMLGAGCVKMQMGLGAWVGCAAGAAQAATWTAIATGFGATATALGVALVAGLGGLDPVRELEPPPGPRPFPAQATLSLGAIAGLLASSILLASEVS